MRGDKNMIIIQINTDQMKTSSQPLEVVDSLVMDLVNDKLIAKAFNLKAFEKLKWSLDILILYKHKKRVKRLKLRATPSDDELLFTYDGNIRHALFFLVQFRDISEAAYKEAVAKLNEAGYKLEKTFPKAAVRKREEAEESSNLGADAFPTPDDDIVIIEEQKEQSLMAVVSNVSYANSSQLLFSHGEEKSQSACVKADAPAAQSTSNGCWLGCTIS
jgi:hypothetical protein